MFHKNNLYTINSEIASMYEKKDVNSEMVSQALFGESFYVLKKHNDWTFIQLKDDNYKGWVLNCKYNHYFKSTHLINIPSTWVYVSPDIKSNVIKKLFAGSKIKIIEFDKTWSKIEFFDKNICFGYIPTKHINKINKKLSWLKIIKQFEDAPYLWGGKTVNGIDCSGLLQLSMKFIGLNIPRDTKDQKTYFQNYILKSKHKNYTRGDIIFWKGHVGIILKKEQLIHANAFHMSVKVERIESTLKRINEKNVVIRL